MSRAQFHALYHHIPAFSSSHVLGRLWLRASGNMTMLGDRILVHQRMRRDENYPRSLLSARQAWHDHHCWLRVVAVLHSVAAALVPYRHCDKLLSGVQLSNLAIHFA